MYKNNKISLKSWFPARYIALMRHRPGVSPLGASLVLVLLVVVGGSRGQPAVAPLLPLDGLLAAKQALPSARMDAHGRAELRNATLEMFYHAYK